MIKTLEEIWNIPECSCLKIVAGRNGLKRQLRWTSAIEVIEIIKFSNEGDLNFITGLKIDTDEEFLLFVTEAEQNNMAGLVVALGPYINKIPKSVLNYGNSHDFPIIIMPWDVKISTLSHAIGDFISDENKKNQIPLELLKSIIIGNDDILLTSEKKRLLESLGLTEDGQFYVLLFQIVQKSGSAGVGLEEIFNKLKKEMRSIYLNEGVIVQMEEGIAIVLKGKKNTKIPDEKGMDEIASLAVKTQLMFDDYSIRIGIGNQYSSIEKIRESYEEAFLVTKLLSASFQHRLKRYRFDQLGIYTIIWECRNSSALLSFSEDILGPLKKYDEINGTDLINFLKAYYDYNGNVMEISKNIFLHKNTVLYKIRKIEGIIGQSFAQQDTVFNLKFALMIEDSIYKNI